jgi:succinyl-CoA synthetase alpha subunit
MAIYLDSDSKIIVQGMTGAEGMKHTQRMLAGGSNIVGGVNPRKAGETVEIEGKSLPVFGSVEEAMRITDANVSVIFVPPAFAKAAMVEAIDAEMPLIVTITEGIPVHDSAMAWDYNLQKGNRSRMIGPNCPGIISPGKSNAGITPSNITGFGPIVELRDIGFSTGIGIGGDPVIGTTHIDALEAFEADDETQAIVLIGEIGGDSEEKAAEYISKHVSKPVVAYVAGFTAPEGKTMGHAGAIVSGSAGTAQAKKEAFEAVGVKVGKTPSETAQLMRDIIAGQ